jgi:hypothetical protein
VEQDVYDNVNEMIRGFGPNFDAGNWINKEALRFAAKAAYDRTDVKLKHVPDFLLDLELDCVGGHRFKPNWLEKCPPLPCFKTDVGLYRPYGCTTNCTVCGAMCFVGIPYVKYIGERRIYGDEAFREVSGKTILTYSYVGFTGSRKSEARFKKEFDKAKKYLAPSMDPDAWVLHVTEIISSDKRNDIEYLKHLDKARAKKGIRLAMAAIQKYSCLKHLNVYSGIGVVEGRLKGEGKLSAQSTVYNSVLIPVIREYTSSGVAPLFYFERTGQDGWAKNLFDGGRLTLLWKKITCGVPVKSPEFVSPSYSYFLEVADIISYVVARNLYIVGARAEGKTLTNEFDSSLLGRVRYIWLEESGDWYQRFCVGLPFAQMFQGTAWEHAASTVG